MAGAKHARSWHSHHYCRENGEDRGCAFTNMCLDWDARFVYYASPDSTHQRAVPPKVNLVPDTVWKLRTEFGWDSVGPLSLKAQWGKTFNFSIHNTHPPSDFQQLPEDNATSVIAAINYGQINIGHALADSVWPVAKVLWMLKDVVGFLEPGTRTRVLLARRCPEYNGKSTCGPQLKAWQMISSLPVVYSDELNGTCFSRLVVGSSHANYIRDVNYPHFRYMPPQPPEGVLGFYTQLARHAQGWKPNLPVVTMEYSAQQKPQLVIAHKPNRRHWMTNESEVIEHLERQFPQLSIKLTDFAGTTAVEELAIMQATSIYITSMGGGSFNTALLPERACAVFLIPCMPWKGASNGVLCQQIKNEMKLWHSATYLSVLSYEHDHARDMQKMMDANHTESAKWPGYDWAYKVNVTRLSALVQTCIDSVIWRRLWRVSPTDTRFTVPHTGR